MLCDEKHRYDLNVTPERGRGIPMFDMVGTRVICLIWLVILDS